MSINGHACFYNCRVISSDRIKTKTRDTTHGNRTVITTDSIFIHSRDPRSRKQSKCHLIGRWFTGRENIPYRFDEANARKPSEHA